MLHRLVGRTGVAHFPDLARRAEDDFTVQHGAHLFQRQRVLFDGQRRVQRTQALAASPLRLQCAGVGGLPDAQPFGDGRDLRSHAVGEPEGWLVCGMGRGHGRLPSGLLSTSRVRPVSFRDTAGA